MIPEFDLLLCGGIDGDVLALQGGDVVDVPRFHVADFAVKAGVEIALMFIAARALLVPGVIGKWDSRRARSVGAPTGDGMSYDRGGIDTHASFDGGFLFLALFLFGDHEVRRGIVHSFVQ